MRRAVIAAAATVAGLVALLDYKSSGTIHRSSVSVRAGSRPTAPNTSAPPTTVPTPSTTAPASTNNGSGTTTPTTAPAATSRTYTGQDISYRYGDIQVQITVAGGRITHISIPQESSTDPRSQSINGQAVPILTSEALSAQGLNFDVVSGATFTSYAFAQSFQTALTQAGK
jgi:uncharacterized protein with FMN-binding domain